MSEGEREEERGWGGNDGGLAREIKGASHHLLPLPSAPAPPPTLPAFIQPLPKTVFQRAEKVGHEVWRVRQREKRTEGGYISV